MPQQKLHLLMCRASQFGISYEINPWMDKAHPPDRRLAMVQQNDIINALDKLGHMIELITPGENLPDMCFAANAGVVRGDKVFLGHLPDERMPEIPLYRQWFKDHGYEIKKSNDRFGGGGDALWCGDRLLTGFGPASRRASDIAVHAKLKKYFGVEVVSLQVKDPRFYDLDMSVAVLSPNLIAVCTAVLDAKSNAKLKALPDVEIIKVSLKDALGFGCNLISDGENVLISDKTPDLIKQLTRRGFNVMPFDIGQFMLAGGGVRCLALNL